MSDTKYNMAVTVTMVFSDESHREAWLIQQGIIPKEGVMPDDRRLARISDYLRRRENTDLQYLVGSMNEPTLRFLTVNK